MPGKVKVLVGHLLSRLLIVLRPVDHPLGAQQRLGESRQHGRRLSVRTTHPVEQQHPVNPAQLTVVLLVVSDQSGQDRRPARADLPQQVPPLRRRQVGCPHLVPQDLRAHFHFAPEKGNAAVPQGDSGGGPLLSLLYGPSTSSRKCTSIRTRWPSSGKMLRPSARGCARRTSLSWPKGATIFT